jgi:hypothetical protein
VRLGLVMRTSTTFVFFCVAILGGCTSAEPPTASQESNLSDEDLASQTSCEFFSVPPGSNGADMVSLGVRQLDYPAATADLRSSATIKAGTDYLSCAYMNNQTPTRFDCTVANTEGSWWTSVLATARPNVRHAVQVAPGREYFINCQ